MAPPSVRRALALAALALLVAAPVCRSDDTGPTSVPSGPPAPGGMVFVDVKGAKIGTPAEEVLKLAGSRQDVLKILMYETPVHEPQMVPYFIDRYEVTNAQFHRFLEDTGRVTTYTTGTTALANLEEIGSYFAYGSPTAAKEQENKWAWSQVYELNKQALHVALPDLLLDEKDKSRKLGDKEARDRFQYAALPPDLPLKVYRWRLPRTWFQASDKLEGDAAPDHPVRDVSYTDAEAFAEWAGKHVITEAEYEWAARGPEGRIYPWGNDWVEQIDEATGKRVVEKRCNWSELGIVNKVTFEPTTVAVTDIPEGQSWCGVFHLLGNVSEWTSSWFDPYPGWNGSLDEKSNKWVKYHGGDYVRVIRGGSCADKEHLALRCAYRDFIGIERKKPPVPANHFEFVGFRCGLYLTPGLDRLEPAIARLLRPKKVRREQLAVDRYAGSVANRFLPTDAAAENHVYVTGRASAVLVIPVKQLFPDTAKPPANTPDELRKFVPSPDALVLGVFHTDVPLKAKVKDPKAVEPEPAGSGRREGRKKEAAMPPTVDGILPPDTYVLGLSHGHVGVYRSNLDFVAFLDKPKIEKRLLKKDEPPPASTLSVEADMDFIKPVRFWVAYGGKGMDPRDGVMIDCLMEAESGALEKAGSWR